MRADVGEELAIFCSSFELCFQFRAEWVLGHGRVGSMDNAGARYAPVPVHDITFYGVIMG